MTLHSLHYEVLMTLHSLHYEVLMTLHSLHYEVLMTLHSLHYEVLKQQARSWFAAVGVDPRVRPSPLLYNFLSYTKGNYFQMQVARVHKSQSILSRTTPTF